ncbi:UDP-glucose 4-epimerase [hydrothermal vent metagenome]|uniref:UDP-glucose 4-epimerase n=1 Tax=hydrothermal vent metagenome TaxID=652676 RepID=A0A1W1CMV9_9ZZZZ
MKIIITGATGFIGHAIAKHLLLQKHEVYAIIRPQTHRDKLPQGISTFIDTSDTKALNQFFQETQADGILHLASLILVNHKAEDIEPLILSNISFSTRLLEVSVKHNLKWFINTGTFWQHYNDEEYNPVNLYADPF